MRSLSKYNWKITPYGKVHLFDPAKPIYYDTGIRLKSSYEIKSGLYFDGQIEKSVFTEYDQIWRGVKGRLPFVRSDVTRYLRTVDDPRLSYLMFNSLRFL